MIKQNWFSLFMGIMIGFGLSLQFNPFVTHSSCKCVKNCECTRGWNENCKCEDCECDSVARKREQ